MNRAPAFVVCLATAGLGGVFQFAEVRGQDKPFATTSRECKAVSFGADETEAARKLDFLASEGREYVGSLGNGLVPFRPPMVVENNAVEQRRLEGHKGYVTMAAFSS